MTDEVLYVMTTLEAVQKAIDPELPVMFDTETIGFYGEIRLAQFYQDGWKHTLIVERPQPMMLVAVLSKVHLVMHNAHYDITCIQANLGGQTWMPEKFDCTFLMARLHFYKEESFSLDNVVSYVLGYNPYKNKKSMQDSDWGAPVLSQEQLDYAGSDGVYLQNVYDVVKERADDINYQLDYLALRYCLDFQNNGMPLDKERLKEKYRLNEEEIKEIALPINCNSYQQVRPYINSNKSDAYGLIWNMLNGNEKAEQVYRTRKLDKENSFIKKFLNTSSMGNIYGKFKLSPRSGRSASEDQNLQQIPRKLKDGFGVEENGDEVIIYSDFSQAQLRLVCAVTADTNMERIFRDAGDIHSYVAEMIFGPEFTKEHRQICKTANFGLLFGAGVSTFLAILVKEAELLLPEEDGKKIKRKWLGLWKQVSAWQKQGIKDWKKKVVWETPLGRRYTAKMMTDQLAMQIQGAEAEVAKLAMHYMLPKLKELSPDIKLRDFVHDSYIFTAPNDPKIYKPASEIVGQSMLEAWKELSQNFKIEDLPMPCNVKVGWNWGDIESDIFIYEYNT